MGELLPPPRCRRARCGACYSNSVTRPGQHLVAFVLALANSTATAASPHDPLDAGDRAWGAGARAAARRYWLQAAASDDPAVAAMAEVRLLQVSGSLGLALHGPRADRTLARCPAHEPWCELADADYQLFLHALGLGGDPARAAMLARRAKARLPGPALARLVWTGTAPPSALDGVSRDGLGDVLRDHSGRWPTGPGTWALGVGMTGAPGLGLGGTVRFIHPDLGWRAWRLALVVAATTRQAAWASADLTTPGRWWWRVGLRGGWLPVDLYAEDALAETVRAALLEAAITPGVREGAWSAWFGPVARADLDGRRWERGHGIRAGVGWVGHAARGWLQGEAALADYRFEELTLELRASRPALGGSAWFRLIGQAAHARTNGSGDSAPVWRLPAAGGGVVLRSAAVGRWRGPALAGAVAELRHPLGRALETATFVEGATVWADAADWQPTRPGVHGDVGGGLRLLLPPHPEGTLRLDVAWGDGGFGVTAGWGEAF